MKKAIKILKLFPVLLVYILAIFYLCSPNLLSHHRYLPMLIVAIWSIIYIGVSYLLNKDRF